MPVEVLQQQQVECVCRQGYTTGGSESTGIYVGADIGHRHMRVPSGMYPKAGAYSRTLPLVSHCAHTGNTERMNEVNTRW